MRATSNFFLLLLSSQPPSLPSVPTKYIARNPACMCHCCDAATWRREQQDEVATREVMRAVSFIVRSKNDHTDFSLGSIEAGEARETRISLSLLSAPVLPPLGFIHNTILEWRLEVDRMVFRFLTASTSG